MLKRPKEDADDEANDEGEEDELDARLVKAMLLIYDRHGFDSEIDYAVVQTIVSGWNDKDQRYVQEDLSVADLTMRIGRRLVR